MRLSQKAIDEFKQIYASEFGESISNDEAQEMGIRLLHVFDLICQPLPADHRCEACTKDKPEVDRT